MVKYVKVPGGRKNSGRKEKPVEKKVIGVIGYVLPKEREDFYKCVEGEGTTPAAVIRTAIKAYIKKHAKHLREK